MGSFKRTLLIVAAIVLAGSATAAFALKGDHWGPFICNECKLSTPLPDAATQNFIQDADMGFIIVPGDSITICANNACVKYTRTNSGWEGGPIIPITSANPGAGNDGSDGGGAAGGNGGIDTPGSGWGNPTPPVCVNGFCGGSGTVTVG